MKVLIKTVFSFMLTSWTYSEVMLIFPEIQPVTEKVIQALKIPTHDKWRIYYDPEYRQDVEKEIDDFLIYTGLKPEQEKLFSSKDDQFYLPEISILPNYSVSYTPLFENQSDLNQEFEFF